MSDYSQDANAKLTIPLIFSCSMKRSLPSTSLCRSFFAYWHSLSFVRKDSIFGYFFVSALLLSHPLLCEREIPLDRKDDKSNPNLYL